MADLLDLSDDSDQLVIDGGVGDIVEFDSMNRTVVVNGVQNGYKSLTIDGTANLLVDDDVELHVDLQIMI